MKRGFTLVEMMMAATVFALVLGGVVSASVCLFRMYRRAMAEAELAIDVHRIREHLLFKLLPEGGSHIGLLGLPVNGVDATSITAVSDKHTLIGSGTGFSTADGTRTYRIMQDGGCLIVEGIAGSRDWLNPDGFKPCGDWEDIVFPVSDSTAFSRHRKLFLDILLSHDGVTRGERIVIPQFGKKQNSPKGNANGIEKP